MTILFLLWLFDTEPAQPPKAIDVIAASGRVVVQGETESQRVNPPRVIAPGKPPILQFRYLEGNLRHRFGDSGLVLDDAGH